MAWKTIGHTCGHEQEHQLFGNSREKERKAAWLEGTLCSTCYKAEKREEEEKAFQPILKAAREADLPPMNGSEKQIAWAEKLRAEELHNLLERLDRSVRWLIEQAPDANERARKLKDAGVQMPAERLAPYFRTLVYEWVASKSESKYWIDSRSRSRLYDFARVMADRAMRMIEAIADGRDPIAADAEYLARQEIREEIRKPAVDAVAEEAKVKAAQGLMLPESPKSSLTAYLFIQTGDVRCSFPEPNEVVRLIMRQLGFAWIQPFWQTRPSDGCENRLVEAGCLLLKHGIPIRVDAPELRERITKADYKPRATRRILVTVKEPKAFVIWWTPDQDWYYQAKSLRGARYVKPNVHVHADNYAEVEDFAEINGFEITAAARQLISRMQAERAKTVAVALPALPTLPEPPKRGDIIPDLPVPAEVGIAPSLMDDDMDDGEDE